MTSAGTISPVGRMKAIVGGSAGNLVEWYDWYAYSAFAIYFAPHFFPKGDTTAQLLQNAAVFALGFMMRPLGAWLMGLYADRAGRRTAMALSVALMCAGSFAIACMPTYEMVGQWAPAGLLVARLVQGLSLGGEYGASATYMSEMAGRQRRGLWASFQYVTLIGGQLIALSVLMVLQNLLPEAALDAWGWRIPFAIGGVLAVVVFWLRSGMEESGSYLAMKAEKKRGGTLALFREHPRETAIVLVLTCGGSLAFYAYTTYMQKFLVNTAGFPKDTATTINAAALVVYMLAQPLFGWLSDKVGRKPLLIYAFAGCTVATWPVMTMLGSANSAMAAFGLATLLLIFLSGYTAIGGLLKAELFPAHVRALGVALPYAIANALFGGTAEYAALWFKDAGVESGFYIYVSVMMGLGLITAVRMRDTKAASMILED